MVLYSGGSVRSVRAPQHLHGLVRRPPQLQRDVVALVLILGVGVGVERDTRPGSIRQNGDSLLAS